MPTYLGCTASRASAQKRPPGPRNLARLTVKASRQGEQPVPVSQGQEVAGNTWLLALEFSVLKLEHLGYTRAVGQLDLQ